MEKKYCLQCKFYEYWHTKVYGHRRKGFFSAPERYHIRTDLGDRCTCPMANYRGEVAGNPPPSQINKNNDCPFHEKGPLKQLPDDEGWIFQSDL
jgi:hypothetical protein